ncbi:MAG: tetratricopeptide repeat protein [Sandaracinus sp.]|nr:tetratricopeptide repeat protein [Sandaracinus sp.]
MGYVLAANGQLGDALEHYREAIELDGSFFEAMLNASEAFLQLGQLQEALAMASDAQDVAHTDDEKADAMLLQIDALLAAGRREEAEALVPDLPRGPFENPHLEFLVGRALYETGDLEGASMRIEQAAGIGSTDPEVYYYLGLVRENRGDVRGATAAFLQSRDLELELARARLGRSRSRASKSAWLRRYGAFRRSSRASSTVRSCSSTTCPAPRWSARASTRARRCCSTICRSRTARTCVDASSTSATWSAWSRGPSRSKRRSCRSSPKRSRARSRERRVWRVELPPAVRRIALHASRRSRCGPHPDGGRPGSNTALRASEPEAETALRATAALRPHGFAATCCTTARACRHTFAKTCRRPSGGFAALRCPSACGSRRRARSRCSPRPGRASRAGA